MPDADTHDRLHEIAGHFTGRVGIAAIRLDGTDAIALDQDALLPTASVGKVPILVEVHRAAEAGELDLEARVSITSSDHVGGSGVLRLLRPELDLTVADLARLMICISDNTATNKVLQLVGGHARVNRAMGDLGLDRIRLNGPVDLARMQVDPMSFGVASAGDLCSLMLAIANAEAFGSEVSRRVEDDLAQQQYLDQGLRYLDLDPYGAELGGASPLRTASKTGRMPGVRMDAGIVRFPTGGYCYVVANAGSADHSFRVESDGSVLAGLLGRVLLEHYWDPRQGPAPVHPAPALPGLDRHRAG